MGYGYTSLISPLQVYLRIVSLVSMCVSGVMCYAATSPSLPATLRNGRGGGRTQSKFNSTSSWPRTMFPFTLFSDWCRGQLHHISSTSREREGGRDRIKVVYACEELHQQCLGVYKEQLRQVRIGGWNFINSVLAFTKNNFDRLGLVG